MKVLALASDNGGCGFYRVRAPAEEVSKLGVDIEIPDDGSVKVKIKDRVITEIEDDPDLIILQRPLNDIYPSLVAQAQRQGIAVVFETDDDFETVHGRNIAHESLHSTPERINPKFLRQCAEMADHVTVSTPRLLKFARHKRATVLRNAIPDSFFSLPIPERDFSSPRIGWSGSVATHPDDLQVTKGAVGEVLKNNGLDLTVIGDGVYVHRNLQLSKETKVLESGWVDVEHYFPAFAENVDICIAPLELSPFNESKSFLKGMEAAAAGMPFIASPTSEYLYAEVCGIGQTAKTPGDWRKKLQRLIDNPDKAYELGQQYREVVREEFNYKHNAQQWLDSWTQAVEHRKRTLPVTV